MAGAVGKKKGVFADINVVPLVDIVLVLLIIMMVTSSFIASGVLKFELPKAANAGEELPTTLNFSMDRTGIIYLNGKKLESQEGLEREIKVHIEGAKSVVAAIAADRRVPHGSVIALVDTIKGLGVEQFAFNIERMAPLAPTEKGLQAPIPEGSNAAPAANP